jgi:diguanylate cyclase (GGDEF)-like protein
MRIFRRNDIFLIGGLAIAVWVVSSRQLGTLLDRAREIDHSRGLQLVPALFILAAVFLIHQFRKREEMRIQTIQATSRVAEMQRLVQFGQALAHSLDGDSIRAAATEHLPALASGRGVWAMFRTSGDWIPLTPVAAEAHAAIERAAARAVADPNASTDASHDDVLCFPLVVAGTAIGAIGVSPSPPLTEAQRSVFAAAAALLAASVKNAELFNEAHENSVRDALTGCFNRRHAMEVMDGELRRVRRSRGSFSVVMFDLDHFKAINDRFGHLCGDAVLAQVGHRMKTVLRGSDVKCRYGGEEFLVLLPDTPGIGARRVAEMLRRDLEDHPVLWNDQAVTITASFGITDIVAGEEDARAIIGRADAALYRAKQDGRNRVCDAEPIHGLSSLDVARDDTEPAEVSAAQPA